MNGMEWADAQHRLARFMYRTHSFAESCKYGATYNYNHGGVHPYGPNISHAGGCPYPDMNTSVTLSREWTYSLSGMWQRHDRRSVLLQLSRPEGLEKSGYGAPAKVWVNIT